MSINYYTNTTEDSIDAKEMELYTLIMSYRQANGLGTIPLSKALTATAGRHALDTVYNMGTFSGHSWSDAPYSSANPNSMWKAPQRIGTGYNSNGYEISHGFIGTNVAILDVDPTAALQGWKASPDHNNVLLNKADWSGLTWKAIGVGIHKGVAHVWFGADTDPTGTPVTDTGGTGGTPIVGTPQRDTFRATAGNDVIDALGELDTVIIAATRATATITKTGAALTVTGTGLGTDSFTNMERLAFSNGTLAFDLDGNAGQTYRLYQAAFARTPDTIGLGHNTRLVDGGLTIKDMSAAFIGSAEFIARYGQNTSNTTFITALYQNVLGRAPDATGLAGWQQRLADGSWSRADVLFGFSESAENKALVGAAIENGIWLG
ncbi:DUF4214 domain-containing protein [Microvirga tunisiensis]|uniref:DUF4214 domain-containing protein n=1 Tax=Pannonibacter tanglangensis TaxID=2750084 RepID=A0A7X5F2R3_9HYPH|nr:DUF4214 domain-containing protein [Pannonibacter sp. XCT-53]NBN78394.1 DUF4214 domain-containing protein [Pannonibacter sp. XCT-53]